MGNIMKIIMYSEMKREESKKIKIKLLEENISKYNKWLKKTHREDKIENYEEFLRAK